MRFSGKGKYDMSKKPVALIIMDGFGYNPSSYGNAIAAAKKPNIDKYLQGPHTLIGASGLDVGLPDGQMGNSEVGHTNIGAGRIVYQMLVKISKAIEDGSFLENASLKNAMENCKEKGSALHLAVFTAILSIFTDFLRWLRRTVLKRFMFMLFWMDVTFLRHLLLNICRKPATR